MLLVDVVRNAPCTCGSGRKHKNCCFALRDAAIDQAGSDAARAAFEAEHPDEVEALVAKEQQRRLRKQAKAGQAEAADDDPQGDFDLGDDEDADADEELSA